ncbi:hypothetical protein CWI75_02000 [Kineobactrum sediminis]|uniref:Rsd/AlgQ family anti-sigma factor n=1 Tax=Kineobactrum sediminis TaxID=1905677 RepID=A0A2N5Y6X6_9GAMM|nr:Rsd/AlgQ family anti-sigma factor [Kineobactrum sediminis]PLW84144.1 hypothetical protein CWI75_02000 [Kineobactrum sediminis]
MRQSKQDPADHFRAVERMLTDWLRERRSLLARYTSLAVATDDSPENSHLARRQRALCELLVDYVSAGHFEVFSALLLEAEIFGDDNTALSTELMPDIADTTEVIMAYEEKYGNGDHYPETLRRDLSALGEILESRFVMEDQLIASLHGKHRRRLQTTPG